MTALVGEPLRAALAELEDYLGGVGEERAAELVLPFATRWVLPELGFELERLRAEAETFVKATPLSDRILAGYRRHLAYWVSQRMRLDAHDAPQPERAASRLAGARALLEARAASVAAGGYPRVAAGLRCARSDAELWDALALRIAESVLP